jgi:hypothetical protein
MTDDYADLVEFVVKAALLPVLERLAVTEAKLATVTGLDTLRERLVALETKAGLPAPADPMVAEIGARLHLLEGQSDQWAPTRVVAEAVKRLELVEQRPMPAVPVVSSDEVAALRDQVSALEHTIATDLGHLRERVAVAEVKAVPGPPGPPGPAGRDGMARDDLTALMDRVTALEQAEPPVPARVEQALTEAVKDLGSLRERVAVAEVKAVQGPPGPSGPPGRDGVDGVSWDEIAVAKDGDRTLMMTATKGDRIKELGRVTFDVEIYKGIWVDGVTYQTGDCVTRDGSEWHCNEPTTSRPGDSKTWTLKVKRGRDGRDGRDALGAPPVVTVRT